MPKIMTWGRARSPHTCQLWLWFFDFHATLLLHFFWTWPAEYLLSGYVSSSSPRCHKVWRHPLMWLVVNQLCKSWTQMLCIFLMCGNESEPMQFTKKCGVSFGRFQAKYHSKLVEINQFKCWNRPRRKGYLVYQCRYYSMGNFSFLGIVVNHTKCWNISRTLQAGPQYNKLC